MRKSSKATSPFAEQASSGPRFSIAALLLIMLVFSGISAALCFAMAVPKVSSELNAWLGRSQETNRDGSDRTFQFVFVMFCYCAPLLMAGVASTLASLFQKISAWRQINENPDEDGLPWDSSSAKRS